MERKQIIDCIGTAMLFAGFLLAFLPHAAHISIGLKDEDHTRHVMEGAAIIFVSLAVLIYNNKALEWMKEKNAQQKR
ncbi:MAG: hypothetical protein HYW26_03490 [Candidatus Aenigmarchaeota archaeon]|nr:hypothetical protein [Candidatus Aenigmarchaeota archaeon]